MFCKVTSISSRSHHGYFKAIDRTVKIRTTIITTSIIDHIHTIYQTSFNIIFATTPWLGAIVISTLQIRKTKLTGSS